MLYEEKSYVYPNIARHINQLLQMSGDEIEKDLGTKIGDVIYGDIVEFEDGFTMTHYLVNAEKPHTIATLHDCRNRYVTSVSVAEKYFGDWEITHNDDTYRLRVLEVPKIELNRDVQRRDEIIFGKYEPEKYSGGVRRFENLDFRRLKIIIEEKFANPFERHNYCPAIREIFDFMETYDGYKAFGYAISIDRGDYAIDIDGLEKNRRAGSEIERMDFDALFDTADEFQNDDEMYAWFD